MATSLVARMASGMPGTDPRGGRDLGRHCSSPVWPTTSSARLAGIDVIYLSILAVFSYQACGQYSCVGATISSARLAGTDVTLSIYESAACHVLRGMAIAMRPLEVMQGHIVPHQAAVSSNTEYHCTMHLQCHVLKAMPEAQCYSGSFYCFVFVTCIALQKHC